MSTTEHESGPWDDTPPDDPETEPAPEAEYDATEHAAEQPPGPDPAASSTDGGGEPEEELPTFEELAGTVAGHTATIAAIIDHLQDTPGGKWSWRTLTASEQRKLWFELRQWVNWLDQRYLRHLSRTMYPFTHTWYRHPVAVELLTALMVSHWAVYNKTTRKASSALVDWHERSLFPTLDRLKSLKLFDDPDNLRPDWAGPTPRDLPLDDDMFREFVRDETAPTPSGTA